jgi:hypothetical protein
MAFLIEAAIGLFFLICHILCPPPVWTVSFSILSLLEFSIVQ